MQKRHVIWALVAVAIAASAATGVFWLRAGGADVAWNRSPDQVVFQLDSFPGKTMDRIDGEAHVPAVTFFGDGKVVFVRTGPGNERHLYEARLTEQQLQSLLALAAQTLPGLKRSYADSQVLDGGTISIALVTAEGFQNVMVYGELGDVADWRARSALQRLYRKALDLLPEDARTYVPDRLELWVQQADPRPVNGDRPWPANLPVPSLGQPGEVGKISLEGAAAREMAWLPVTPLPRFRLGEAVYIVRLVPPIPKLHPW